MAIGSLAVAGSALAADTNVLNQAQGLSIGTVKVDFMKMLDQRIARLQDEKAKIQAILSRDYATWKSLTEKLNPQTPALKTITADNFEKFAQMHEALQNGDKQKAEALRKELGLQGVGLGLGQGKGAGMGMGKMRGQARGQGNGRHMGWAK